MLQVKVENCSFPSQQTGEDSITFREPHENIMFGNMQLFLGMSVEAMDSDSFWYPAKIIGIHESNRKVLIHFDGFNQRHDRWCDVFSNSIRPISDDETLTDNQQADVKANDVVDNNTDDSQSNKEIIDTFETQRRHMGNLRSRSDSRVKAGRRRKFLSGISFAFEGTCSRITERHATRLIKNNGGKCKRYITPSIKYVILGENPSHVKLEKIKKYGIQVMKEVDFVKFARKLSKKSGNMECAETGVSLKSKKKERAREGPKHRRLEARINDAINRRSKVIEPINGMPQLKLVTVPISPTAFADSKSKTIDNGNRNCVVENAAAEVSESPSLETEFRRKSRLRKSAGSVGDDEKIFDDSRVTGVQNCLAGMNFSCEGQICIVPAAKLVYRFGGKFFTNITSSLDYLITGKDPCANKIDKALAQGTKIVRETQLLQLIRDQSAKMLHDARGKEIEADDSNQVTRCDLKSLIGSPSNMKMTDQDSCTLNQSTFDEVSVNSNGVRKEQQGRCQHEEIQRGEGDEEDEREEAAVKEPSRQIGNRQNSVGKLDNGQEGVFSLTHQGAQNNVCNQSDGRHRSDRPNGSWQNDLESQVDKRILVVKSIRRRRTSFSTGQVAKNAQFGKVGGEMKNDRNHSDGNKNNAFLNRKGTSAEGFGCKHRSSLSDRYCHENLATNVTCSENCGAVIERNKISNHLKCECKNAETECHICGFKMLRKDIDDHIAMNVVKHMKILGREINADKSLYGNVVVENLNLLKKVDELQTRLVLLERDVRRQRELYQRLDEQNQYLARQNKKLAGLCHLTEAIDDVNTA